MVPLVIPAGGVGVAGGVAPGCSLAICAAPRWVVVSLIPTGRGEALVPSGTMLSFVLYASAVMWVFAVRSALRAWVGILGVTGLLAAILWFYRSMQ